MIVEDTTKGPHPDLLCAWCGRPETEDELFTRVYTFTGMHEWPQVAWHSDCFDDHENSWEVRAYERWRYRHIMEGASVKDAPAIPMIDEIRQRGPNRVVLTRLTPPESVKREGLH